MIKRKIISALLAVSVGSAMLSALPVNAERFSIKGDVNADGEFSIADLVMMQSYLLGKGGLASPSAGDLFADGRLNVFDLIKMREMYI